MFLALVTSGQAEPAHGLAPFFAELGVGGVALFLAPFAALLFAIAFLPVVVPHFWEHHRNKALVSLACALPVGIFLLARDWRELAATLLDYGAFIGLLAALFTISGGIYLRGALPGTSRALAVLFVAGAVLANLIGTTGASMVLIRPLLRATATRRHRVHTIVFFIFIVSNAGGLLTPMGDPPLFLGFLNGVPFAWTLRLWPEWLTVVAALVAAFFLFDMLLLRREPPGDAVPRTAAERPGLEGAHNVVLLGVVVGVLLAGGYVVFPLDGPAIFGEPFGEALAKIVQMAAMAGVAFVSYRLTTKSLHERNEFSFGPIVEVAVLFAGIFIAMVPALLILEGQGAKLGVNQPWQFFLTAGALSSMLDNAPTYLTFTSLAKGVAGVGSHGLAGLVSDPAGATYLAAVSAGAVFFGAMTYIGNAPNFMVRAIAREAGVLMPSFVGYVAWSAAVLLPVFGVVAFVFFT